MEHYKNKQKQTILNNRKNILKFKVVMWKQMLQDQKLIQKNTQIELAFDKKSILCS